MLFHHDLTAVDDVDAMFGVGNLAATEVVDGLVFVFVAKRFVFVNIFNPRRQGVVVGLSIDVGLVELDAIGPLLHGALLAPREPVACPVGGGGAAHYEPHILALGRTFEGNGRLWIVVVGRCNVAIYARAVLLQGHEAQAPACAVFVVIIIASGSCFALKLHIDGLGSGGCIESDGVVAPVLDAVGLSGPPVVVCVLGQGSLAAESDATLASLADGSMSKVVMRAPYSHISSPS